MPTAPVAMAAREAAFVRVFAGEYDQRHREPDHGQGSGDASQYAQRE
jgi:hypothetical protein